MKIKPLDLALHPKQSVAFISEATEILYGGAAGAGKSHLMRTAAIYWCSMIPGLQVYIFRRLSPDLIKNHMEGPTSFPAMLSDWVNAKVVKIRSEPSEIEFWNGSKIFLCHCQYEKDKFKYQGSEIHFLVIDELTHFTESIYRYLRGRVRLGGLEVPKQFAGLFPRVLCGSNPGGVGHNWVKASFIDIQPPMATMRTSKAEGGMVRQYVPARLDDNPTLQKTDPDYIDRLEGLGSPELVRAMKEGDWDIVSGGMFDDVWNKRIHVLPPFEVPSSWRIDRAFDWGSSKPFAVGWYAESDGTPATVAGVERHFPRGSVIHIAEYYGWNGKVNQGCKMLAVDVAKEIVKREKAMGIWGRVKNGPADSAIFSTENGNCIADDMAKGGVKWEAADKSPGSRKNGWEKCREMLSNALPARPESPGFWVVDTCIHFIRTVPVLPRDESKPDDVDTDAEDHIADAWRYRLTMPKRTVRTRELSI